MQETVNRFGIGRPVRRVEYARFLTGRSQFVADVDLPRQAYGAVGSPPTIVNAILDALRPLGVSHIEMPATPNRVWRAIKNAPD